ncbi:hypothetical protein BCV69DRAFT_312716 [Microstroma glucosiphilum]|uniref:Uncharacterized protein n=1 Tax=Pseudomicrostroma glucosiphilum TaxID=1684307 RepID=A0A316U6C7_9BASI|nr:hypothetical protein BCV69DRAFT_312716 [Pseudomicrostroma glucosiphilum]PWN20772.1 hypothetical protein BCV69DRAFT_312716 [Pseudomicrostroma glucosiphilum]
MPPKVKSEPTSPSKVRFDTSPGNANGWLPATEWGAQETQRCITLLASLALDNRSYFYTDEALKPWNYNGASPINKKLQQILAKICKDHDVTMPIPSTAVRSPKKRSTTSADDDEDTKPNASPKKPRKQVTTSPEKAAKGLIANEAGPSMSPEGEEHAASSSRCSTHEPSFAHDTPKTQHKPVTPTKKPTCRDSAKAIVPTSADSSEEDDDEDERPFSDRGRKEEVDA